MWLRRKKYKVRKIEKKEDIYLKIFMITYPDSHTEQITLESFIKKENIYYSNKTGSLFKEDEIYYSFHLYSDFLYAGIKESVINPTVKTILDRVYNGFFVVDESLAIPITLGCKIEEYNEEFLDTVTLSDYETYLSD